MWCSKSGKELVEDMKMGGEERGGGLGECW